MRTSPGVWNSPKHVPERLTILLELADLVGVLAAASIELLDEVTHRRTPVVKPFQQVHEPLAGPPTRGPPPHGMSGDPKPQRE